MYEQNASVSMVNSSLQNRLHSSRCATSSTQTSKAHTAPRRLQNREPIDMTQLCVDWKLSNRALDLIAGRTDYVKTRGLPL